MGESLTALYLQNPELANAIRRRQSGMAMMQQGTDASPIASPWQGVSRLAQALLGGYEARKGDEEIKGSGEKRRKMLADIMSGTDAPPVAPQAPAAAPVPGMPGATQTPLAAPPGGAVPPSGSPDLMGLVAPIAQKYGVPLDLALGLFKQESSGNPNAVGDGGQSVGLGQIQAATARDPGYGVAPMDPNQRTDPTANVDFALRYLVNKGRHFGATDLSNPDHRAIALRAYNGGGDPNYVANVQRQMPAGQGGMATPVAAQGQGAPQPPQQQAGGMGAVQFHMDRAQRLQAAGFQQEAQMEMQRAQLAQREALARQPQETEAHRLAVQAGLQPGTPEYQNAMRGILEGKARGQTTNITMPPQTQTGPIPPGFQLVQRDGGLRMEAIPGGPADRQIAKEGGAAGAKKEGEIRTSNIVLEDIDRITKLMETSILPTTGLGAGTAAMIPGTGASDVNKLLEGIKANIGFDTLNKMRAESPTGAALGAVTERELQFLQAVRGSLDQVQSEDQFKRTLARLREGFAEVIHGPKWREVVSGGETTPAAGPAANDMPTIADPAEASRLPPGTVFRTPDGRQLRVPNR
jgi:hypothetical protein